MSDAFELLPDSHGKLTLKRTGQEDVADVRIRRAFPWSTPGHYISIRSSEGKELVMVEDLTQLPGKQKQIVEQYLDSTTFIPRIVRIDSVDVRFGHQIWRVQTDRGPAEFRVQEREDIRFLSDGRFTIKDADGNIYEMPSLDQLDDSSRKAIEALV